MMTTSFRTGGRPRRLFWLGALMALGAVGGLAQPWTPPAAAQQERASRAVGLPLQEAQRLAQAGDYAAALEKVREATNVVEKSAFDLYMIDEVKVQIYQGMGDDESLAAALEATIRSGRLDAENARSRLKAVALLYYQSGDYARAADVAKGYIRQHGADEDLSRMLADVALRTDDYAGAAESAWQLINAAAARGETPTEDLIRVLLTAAYQQDDEDATFEAFELLVEHHPKPEHWRDLILLAQQEDGFDRNAYDVDVYRLMLAADVALSAEQRVGMAELALIKGLPGEAAKVLEEGFATGALGGDDRQQRLLESARERAVADKAALAALEQEARAAGTGQQLAVLGEALIGYGDYAKAAELIELGLAKGGVSNTNAARLHLGVAQFRDGDPASARRTWAELTAADGSARLGKIWTLVSESEE
jgi:hypothetical protein